MARPSLARRGNQVQSRSSIETWFGSITNVTTSGLHRRWSFEIFDMVSGLLPSPPSLSLLQEEVSWPEQGGYACYCINLMYEGQPLCSMLNGLQVRDAYLLFPNRVVSSYRSVFMLLWEIGKPSRSIEGVSLLLVR